MQVLQKLKVREIVFVALATFLASAAIAAKPKFIKPSAAPAGGDGGHYSLKPDLAYVEYAAPLTRAERNAITMEDLKTMTQEELDQLYARIGSGPIPSVIAKDRDFVDFKGAVLFRKEMSLSLNDKINEVLAKKNPKAAVANLAVGLFCGQQNRLDCLAELIWSGKRFYKPTADGSVQLRNGIDPKLRAIPGAKKYGLNQLEKELDKVPLESFLGPVVDGRMTGLRRMMLFPAVVYCGQSLFDSRKESIVIDYAYGDDFNRYSPAIEGIAGRDGFWVRDEIRMVRPGLYLGRAYIDRLFVLSFALESGDIKNTGYVNQCWNGDSFN